jgi:hypothetical protein
MKVPSSENLPFPNASTNTCAVLPLSYLHVMKRLESKIYLMNMLSRPISTRMNESLNRIARRLGGVRFKEVGEELKKAFDKPKVLTNHAGWIQTLLNSYYDPCYQRDLKRQSDQIVFEGSANEILEFISVNFASKNL